MANPRDINFIKSKDVVEESLFLDLKQFEERTVIDALISTVSTLKQKLYDQAVILSEGFLLDQATGVQLDIIGEELGIPRLGQDDITYRIFLQLASYKSKSVGTRPEIIDIVSRIVGGPLDEILTYSGVSKSVDISLFLACFDSKTTTEELLETFPLVTSHRVVDRFGTGWVFNSENSPVEQKNDSGFVSVFDQTPELSGSGGSRLGTLVSSSDSFQTQFPYTGLADRYTDTYLGFGTTQVLTREFKNGFLQLRRASDDSLKIINALNGQINIQNIVDFDDTSDMFVVRWYDQVTGFDFHQPLSGLQPKFDPSDRSISFDLFDDTLSLSGLNPHQNATVIVDTVFGNTLSIQDIDTTFNCPLLKKLTGLVLVERPLKLGEYNSYVRLTNTSKKIFIGTTVDSTIFHRVDTSRDGGDYQIDFHGDNDVNFSTTSNNVTTDLNLEGLLAPYTVTFTYDMYKDVQINNFDISGNNLYGYFPRVNEMNGLVNLNVSSNNISGNLPDLSKLTNLYYVNASNNNITGYVSHNESGVFPISPSVGEVYLQNNNLKESTVDRVLLDLVEGGRTSIEGVCIVNLSGTGNSPPSPAGIASVNTLINRGWTVTIN